MKKLLILVPCISYGGLENVAISTAEALRNYYDVTILYFYASEKEISTDIPKVCLNVPYSLNLFGQVKVMLKRHFLISGYKKEHKPDICMAVGKVASISNILAKGKARCIASIHGYTDVPHSKPSALIHRLLFARADNTICVSKALAEEFISATGIAPNKVTACANPFNVPELIAKSNETANIPVIEGNPKLFAFGRLVEGKNFELALEAVHLLKQDYPNIHLSIGGDGEHLPVLQEMAQTLEIADNVTFLGMLPNPFAALKQADLLLNPSWNEGFGNTIVESFLCGVPVIATDCKVGPRENIAPSSDLMKIATETEFAEFGVLVPPSYPSDTPTQRSAKAVVLANATRALLQDEVLCNTYATRGMQRMELYALPHYIAQLTKILEG